MYGVGYRVRRRVEDYPFSFRGVCVHYCKRLPPYGVHTEYSSCLFKLELLSRFRLAESSAPKPITVLVGLT